MDLYLRGERDRIPPRPKGYFGAEAEAKLSAMDFARASLAPKSKSQDLSIIEALAPAEATMARGRDFVFPQLD